MARKGGLVGMDNVLRNLTKEIKKIKGRSQVGVLKAAMFIKGEAQKRTPIVTGNLRNSAYVKAVPGMSDPVAEVGFSAVYALSVHENVRSGKTGGMSPSGKKYTTGRTTSGKKSGRIVFATEGEWKFLENPLKENTTEVLNIIKRNVQIKR